MLCFIRGLGGALSCCLLSTISNRLCINYYMNSFFPHCFYIRYNLILYNKSNSHHQYNTICIVLYNIRASFGLQLYVLHHCENILKVYKLQYKLKALTISGKLMVMGVHYMDIIYIYMDIICL